MSKSEGGRRKAEGGKGDVKTSGQMAADHEPTIPGPDFTVPNEGNPVAELDCTEAMATQGESEATDSYKPTIDVDPPAPPQPPHFTQVVVDVPLGDVPLDAYMTSHVEVRMTHDQAYALRGLWYGLKAAGECLAAGKPIVSNADVIRWLLEQVSRCGDTAESDAAESES